MNLNKDEFSALLMQTLRTKNEQTVFDVTVVENTQEILQISCRKHPVSFYLKMERLYEIFRTGISIDDISELIAELIQKKQEEIESNLAEQYAADKDFSEMVLPCFMKADQTDIETKHLVRRHIMDFVLTYMLSIPTENGSIHMYLTEEILEKYNLDESTLYEKSLQNLMVHNPPALIPMTSMMREHGVDADSLDEMMWIATTENHEYGSVVLLYDEFMKSSSEVIGGDFYILPSSIHELIFLRAEEDMRFEELRKMVMEINRAEVSEEEQLSDEVYYYNARKNHIFLGHLGYDE